MMRREALVQGMEPEYEEAQAPPAAPAQDVTAELKKLADLHAAGALTDEEFSAAKAQLLGT